MKKKISKLLAVFLSLAVLLLQTTPAFAALSVGTKYDFTTTYLNAYYDTGNWTTADGYTHKNSGQVALRRLKSTGEPVYCLQIYKAVNADAATASNIKNTNLWKNELSDANKTGITRTSIYGYPNYTYGYSATNAQLATQVLLWDFEIGRRTGYAIKTTAFAEAIFENYPDAKKCYLKIVEACANHTDIPSFDNTKITLRGNGSDNAVTITDTNGVLSDFKISSTNSRVKASISGNKLTVYCTGTGSLSSNLILTKDCTNIDTALGLIGANQTLLYGTFPDPVNSPITIELLNGSITIHKTSEDGNNSVSFKVTGNGINKTVTTNTDGLVTVSDLPEGTYEVTEINKSQYHPHTEAKTATVTAGGNANVYFHNILVKGKINIEKQGEILSSVKHNEDGTYSPIFANKYLAGAEYKIYAAENIVNGTINIPNGTLVDTVVTGSNGKVSSSNLYLKADGTAKYKVVETKAPQGYVLDKTEHIVQLKMTQAGIDTSETLKLFDEKQRISISFKKELEKNELFSKGLGTEMLDISFGLFAAQNITAADGTIIPEGALIEKISPNTDGVCTLNSNLPYASYYIQEIATNDNYILSDTKYQFNFNFTNQNVSDVEISINDGKAIINNLKSGNISGVKVDDNGTALEGALIGLFKADETLFTEDTALMLDTSKADGSFSFDGIPYGAYIVKELAAPEGYLLDENYYKVSIKENLEVVKLNITDKLIRGSIEGLKVDDNGAALKGALIGLFKADETLFTEDTALMLDTSKADGSFSFDSIPYGNYIVKELAAPEGYLLDENYYKVSIKENLEVVKLNITDKLIRGSIEGLKVDNNGAALEGALIGLFKADEISFTKNTALMLDTSKADGSFSFDSIPYGAYIVKELSAPGGYKLDENSYKVSIKKNLEVVQIKIVNTRLIGKLTLNHNYQTSPKTGFNYTMPSLLTALGIASIVTYALSKKKGKSK